MMSGTESILSTLIHSKGDIRPCMPAEVEQHTNNSGKVEGARCRAPEESLGRGKVLARVLMPVEKEEHMLRASTICVSRRQGAPGSTKQFDIDSKKTLSRPLFPDDDPILLEERNNGINVFSMVGVEKDIINVTKAMMLCPTKRQAIQTRLLQTMMLHVMLEMLK